MRLLVLTVSAAVFGYFCHMPTARAADHQTVHHFQRSLTTEVSYKYLLALPKEYQAGGERRWPLMVFLHGAGERGDDVWSVAKHGPPKLLRGENPGERGAKTSRAAAKLLAENFIVVSPQCPKGSWWDTPGLLALLDDIASTHAVDPTRVYLTGLSMGGFGTWDLAATYPERFAAIAPVCGGGQFPPLYQSDTQKRADLRRLAVWAFHGAKDESVPLSESQRMMELLRRFQVEDIKLTVYPEAEHDSWTETYDNPELYSWFLRQRRDRPNP